MSHAASSSSMTRLRGRCPKGPGAAFQGSVRTLKEPDLGRGPEVLRSDGALRHRPTDEPRHLRGLCGDPARSHSVTGRCGHPRQFGRPQKLQSRSRHQGPWRMDAVPAALQPRLNPIEMAFSKLKARLRARAIHTIDGLWRAIAHLPIDRSHGLPKLQCRRIYVNARRSRWRESAK